MAVRKRITLTGISPETYVTEADRRALEALERVPLLAQVLRKFFELGLDRWMYCINMSSSVRCGPSQFRSVYGIFRESCSVLDMPEPELYVTGNPFPNAFAGGVERPYVTVRSSILDTLTDDELYHLFGHELGHIRAGHMLYHTVGRLIVPLLQALGRRLPLVGDVAAIGLVFAFHEWLRQSEISCDRAGLLVSQDFEVSMKANLALAAGPSRYLPEAELGPFLEQARAYHEAPMLDQIGKIILYFTSVWAFSHPMPVHRAQELDKWVSKGEFEKILRGEYVRIN